MSSGVSKTTPGFDGSKLEDSADSHVHGYDILEQKETKKISKGKTAYIPKTGQSSPLLSSGTEKYIPAPSQTKNRKTKKVITEVVIIFFVFFDKTGFSNFGNFSVIIVVFSRKNVRFRFGAF